MPSTYTLISSNVLSSSAASVTFSSIPSTYTDLVLRVSARNDAATIWSNDIVLQLNGSGFSTSLFSNTELTGNGATASSARNSNGAGWNGDGGRMDTAGNTSNTFTSDEWYISNYTGSSNKVASRSNASEQNATTAYINASANLWRSTAAITSIWIGNDYGSGNFVSGSSFYLYGVKNS